MMKKEKRPTKASVSRPRSRPGAEGKSFGATSRPQFPVVGIGASAGGLEACTALLKALPVNPGMAFVLVQHLDPHHESILHKLLSKATEMPVIQVEDGMVLEPDHVYVIPPKHDIAVREMTLRLLSRRRTAGRHLPVNRFFASLAEDQKSAAIGVILSGTASDCTLGFPFKGPFRSDVGFEGVPRRPGLWLWNRDPGRMNNINVERYRTGRHRSSTATATCRRCRS
jgi:two-component system, chemotaxis family, CheB/CheR fusion protein